MTGGKGRPRPDLHLLSDIVFWGERVSQHLSGVDEAEFLSTPALSDAVCWCISCIGEAAGRLRQEWPDVDARNAELELANAYAMRNRIAHGYFDLDEEILWQAATVSIPKLVAAARRVLDATP